MAVPYDLFTNKSGVALMRYSHALNEWFFVRWVEPGVDVHVSTPGAGGHTYQIWTIMAAFGSVTEIHGYGSTMSIHALEVSK